MVESTLTTALAEPAGAPHHEAMILYRILLFVAAAVAAVLLYFFVTGVEDGSVSSFNILIWLVMLAAVGVPISLAWMMRGKGNLKTANLLLLIPAVPGLLAFLFFAMLMLLQPRWN